MEDVMTEISKILMEELNRCSRDEELLDFLHYYESKQRNWKEFMQEQLFDLELSYEKFGKRCGFSKNTIRSWCVDGVLPRSREHFIKLGFGLDMNEEQLNRLLQDYGGYASLYAKDVYDAICIYVIRQRKEHPGDEAYSYPALVHYRERYEAMCQGHSFDQEYRDRVTTGVMHEKLLLIADEWEFDAFMTEHMDIFRGTHSKLIDYMENYIKMRGGARYEGEEAQSLHQLARRFEKPQGFEVAYSKLKRHGILPERNMLIDFGIGMTMTLAEINQLLELAQMRPLDVRNRYECIMIYLFHNHENANPMLSLDNAYSMKEVTQHPEILKHCEEIITYFYQMEEEGILEEEGDDDKSLRTLYEDYRERYGKF